MHRASVDCRVSVHVVMTGVIFVFLRASHPTSTLDDDVLVTFSFALKLDKLPERPFGYEDEYWIAPLS